MSLNKKAHNELTNAAGNVDFLLWDLQAIDGTLHGILRQLEDALMSAKSAHHIKGEILPDESAIMGGLWVASRYYSERLNYLEEQQEKINNAMFRLDQPEETESEPGE